LKARIEQAASHEQLSVNAWLGRVATAALRQPERKPQIRGGRVGDKYTGWAR